MTCVIRPSDVYDDKERLKLALISNNVRIKTFGIPKFGDKYITSTYVVTENAHKFSSARYIVEDYRSQEVWGWE